MHDLADGRVLAKGKHAGMPAIDQLETAARQIEPHIAQRHEAFEVDQLPHHVGMRQRHDFLGLRHPVAAADGDQMAQGFKKVALRRGGQQRRRDALAHDVGDDDVEAAGRHV